MPAPRFAPGTLWSMVNAAATVLIPFATFVFFARIAGPDLIGVVALAVSCADVLKTLGMQGIYEALLPRPAAERRHHETACAILLTGGLVLMVAYLAVLWGLALMQPAVRTHWMGLALVGLRIPIDLAAVQPQAALAQRLLYGRLSLRTLLANVIAGVVGAVVALRAPLAGLIAYQILVSGVTLALTVHGGGMLARPRFHRDCYRDMAAEGWWATAVRFVAATVVNLDQIIVAALAGSTTLAFFNLGKRIETALISVANAFVGVSFQPQFARRDPPPALVLRRGVLVLTVLCSAVAVAFLLRGGRLIGLLFGRSWAPAAGIVGILAASGAVRAIGCVPGALLSVAGRNRQLLAVAAGSAAGSALAAALAPLGLVWCGVALLIKNGATIVWLAAGQRDLVPRPWAIYAGAAAAPFALIAALGALVGLGVPAAFGVTGLLPLLIWLVAGIFLGCAAALCLGEGGVAWWRHAARRTSPAVVAAQEAASSSRSARGIVAS